MEIFFIIVIVVIALIVFGFATGFIKTGSQLIKEEHRVRDKKAQEYIASGRERKEIKVKLPTIPWDADRATKLIAAFYQLKNYGSIRLEIHSKKDKPIEWKIIVFEDFVET